MPLDLTGKHTTEAIEKASKPETTIGAHASDADGGTVTADVTSTGAWWRLSAWLGWNKKKGTSAGADAEIKF